MSFAGMRWLRHQHTLEAGFFGPTIVRTSSKRACVAGWTVNPCDLASGGVAMGLTLAPGDSQDRSAGRDELGRLRSALRCAAVDFVLA
ncbi:hypothetical protein GCM10023339_28360 [Alloalcanivorax gelatiniphagus]